VKKGGWKALIRISKRLRDAVRAALVALGPNPPTRLLFCDATTGLHDEVIYTDASIKALGIILPSLGEVMTFPHSGETLAKYFINRRISIPGLEGLAIVVAPLIRAASLDRPRRIKIFTDSELFLKASVKGYSTADLLHESIMLLIDIEYEYGLEITCEFIPTHINPADLPTKTYPPLNTVTDTPSLYLKVGGRKSAWTASCQPLPTWVSTWIYSRSNHANPRAELASIPGAE